jgi:cobalt-zinc-cadmium efflux system outer membrane protein
MLILVSGCVQVPRKGGFDQVQGSVADRIDVRPNWVQGADESKQAQEAVDKLLKDKLTASSVIQIALLNNASLQSHYEDLGISQAELVEAGLLKNPTVFGRIRFPTNAPGSTNLEFGLFQGFLDVLMLPARKKIASLQFEQIQAEVAQKILDLSAEAEHAYFDVVGAANIRQLRFRVAEAAQASYEFAVRLHSAGNVSALNLSLERSHLEEARVLLAESENKLQASREKLTKSMGLWGERISWKVPDQLPDIPANEIVIDQVESLAIMNRLDLKAARKKVDVQAQALGTKVAWRWVGDAEIGVSAERDSDRHWVVGPELTLELPIFDLRQPKISHAEAQLRKDVNELTALAVEIRSDVRALRDKLIMQRYLVDHYKRVVIPLKERIVALTLQEYNYMLVGAFDLLLAKQQEYATYAKYLEAVRDYWILRAELGRAVGGRLPE